MRFVCNHSSCQCVSTAYEWRVRDNLLGCLLSDALTHLLEERLDDDELGLEPLNRIDCTSVESFMLCSSEGTKDCYFRVRIFRKDNHSDDATSMNAIYVEKSLWPHCRCAPGYGGLTCNFQFDPCLHSNVGAITDLQEIASSYTDEGLHVPLLTSEEMAGASGNYLCGKSVGRGRCERKNRSVGGRWKRSYRTHTHTHT